MMINKVCPEISINQMSKQKAGLTMVDSPNTAIPVSLDDIRHAQTELQDKVVRTPLVKMSDPLSGLTNVHLKLENFQATGSFKDRGAYLKLSSLTDAQRKMGVVAMSAGNHAQGVAYHAKALGIPATIIMPINAPITKVERTKGLGATVIQAGETLDEAKSLVDELIASKGLTLVHPFDDAFVVKGQGTVGLEILEDLPNVERVIVPIGGGGLLSGIAIAIKALKPEVELIGVEVETYASMNAHLAGETGVFGGATIADGIAVKAPGGITANIVGQLVDKLITIKENEVERGVFKLLESANVVSEGAGAAPMGALLSRPELQDGKNTVLLVCGGNIDLNTMANIIRRGLLNMKRVAKLRVLIDDRPGVLSKVTQVIGSVNGNILDVTHRRTSCEHSAKNAYLDLTIETAKPENLDEISEALTAIGFKVTCI